MISLEIGKTAIHLAAHAAIYGSPRHQHHRQCLPVVRIKTYCGNENEHGLVDEISLCKQTKAEVDEDKILAELSQCPEHIFACSLGSFTHVVVCVVFEGYTTEKQ